MLSELCIENFAIIDRIELQLEAGLVTFTGETGAGKSIIIDAVEAILGGRTDPTFVRRGTDPASLEGVFRIPQATQSVILGILEREELLDDPDYLNLGREIRSLTRFSTTWVPGRAWAKPRPKSAYKSGGRCVRSLSMGDEQDRLMNLFNEARARSSPEEREAYLTAACGGDIALRRYVEALLKADTQAGNFLKPPSDDPPDCEGSGTVIGHYKLLQRIGEGGFGVVYMAEQLEPMRRKVAFKIIKLGMDTREVIARFEAERQALAMMDHPNIARVFDAASRVTLTPGPSPIRWERVANGRVRELHHSTLDPRHYPLAAPIS